MKNYFLSTLLPKADEAFHQLMFAAASQLSHRLVLDVSDLERVYSDRGIDIKGRTVQTLVCPILITTASLSILESKSVKDFDDSEKASEVSTPSDLLVHSAALLPLRLIEHGPCSEPTDKVTKPAKLVVHKLKRACPIQSLIHASSQCSDGKQERLRLHVKGR